MILKNLTLQNFRNYAKSAFSFSSQATIIFGPNASGKSNIIEAINLLSTGKSNRSDKDIHLIQFGKNICRIKGVFTEKYGEEIDLEIVFSANPSNFLQKKYLINGVSKRRIDFATTFPSVVFTPVDLDIVAGQPGVRRKFLDEVLSQVDQDYSLSHTAFVKALRQRNALLEKAQGTGRRDERQFEYWDKLLIKNGQIVTKKRGEFIEFINTGKKEIFDFILEYEKSTISEERLLKYKNAEIGAGVTLVGPHRDDVVIKSENKLSKAMEEVRYFGSRGQQRLVALELKLAQISLIKEKTDNDPILLLDDVFSELDGTNIKHVLNLMNIYQTIATTTHEEFVGKNNLNEIKLIELSGQK